MRFQIRIPGILRGALLLIGVRKSRAYVELTHEAVEIHYGRTYRYALDNIRSVETMRWRMYYGYGIRYVPDNVVGFVASSKGVVVMHLIEEREVKIGGPLKLKAQAIAVSLDDPEGFVEAVRERLKNSGKGAGEPAD